MVEALRSATCKVTFTKVNGDTRIMSCTLNSSVIPSEEAPHNPASPDAPTSARTDAVIAVYDVIAEGWRSFRVDNVTEFVYA